MNKGAAGGVPGLKLPHFALEIIEKLGEAGFCAYAVGGCVRDCVMQREPLDWDIATSALPADIMQIFEGYKVIETGVRHGTLTVMVDAVPVEITTFRLDGEYTDNRRPDSVEFISDIRRDLSRRDFTVNALAYSPAEGLIDYFGGLDDIASGTIRCVGDAELRFYEDALRILRGLRFASVLDFDIEPSTAAAIRSCKRLLKNISPERIAKELLRLLCGTRAQAIIGEYREVFFEMIPQLSALDGYPRHGGTDAFEHTLDTLSRVPPAARVRVAALLHDVGLPATFAEGPDGAGYFTAHSLAGEQIARDILTGLRFSKKFTESVCALVEHHELNLIDNPVEAKKLLGRIGPEQFFFLMDLMQADAESLSPEQPGRAEAAREMKRHAEQLLLRGECLTLSDLALNGRDLMAAGIRDGKTVGMILERLFRDVLEKKVENRRDALMERARLIFAAGV